VSTSVSPLSHSDGHNFPGGFDEAVSGLATGIDDGPVVGEDAVEKIGLAQVSDQTTGLSSLLRQLETGPTLSEQRRRPTSSRGPHLDDVMQRPTLQDFQSKFQTGVSN